MIIVASDRIASKIVLSPVHRSFVLALIIRDFSISPRRVSTTGRNSPTRATASNENPIRAPQGQGPLEPKSRYWSGIHPVKTSTSSGIEQILAILTPYLMDGGLEIKLDVTCPMRLIVSEDRSLPNVTRVMPIARCKLAPYRCVSFRGAESPWNRAERSIVGSCTRTPNPSGSSHDSSDCRWSGHRSARSLARIRALQHKMGIGATAPDLVHRPLCFAGTALWSQFTVI